MPTISSTTTLTLAAGQAYVFLAGSGVGIAVADPGGRSAKYSIGPQQTAIGPFSTSVSVDVMITSGSIEYRVDTDGDLRDQDPAIAAQAAAIASVEANAAFVKRNAAGDVTGLETTGGENPLSPASGQAQRLLNKLRFESADSTMLVIGDSTGNSNDEWVYLIAEWIASQFPAVSVDYRAWNGSAYNSATAIQAGTGSTRLTVYNASVAGTRPDYFLGSRYDTIVKALPQVDLFICNHGQNISGALNQDHESALILELTEQVLLDHQDAGVLVVSQNPRRDDTTSDRRSHAVRDVCALRGFGLVDVYSKFIQRSKAASLYADNIHPSTGIGTESAPTGTRLFVDAVKEHFNGIPVQPVANLSLLSQNFGPNLLDNGSFATYTTTPGAPDGWTAVNATFTKDTTFKFGPNQYSVKGVGTGAGQPTLRQDFSAAKLDAYKGQRLFLAVAVYTPSGEDSYAARPALVGSSNNGNNYLSQNEGQDRFRWKFLPFSSTSGETYIRLNLFVNTGSTSTGTCYFGAAIVRAARLPSVGGY